MSHFAVVVVTSEYPTEAVLKKALQPYHEYECTGIADEYVIHFDRTDEALASYETDTTRFLIDLEGNKHSPYIEGNYDPHFLRVATAEEIEAGNPFNASGRDHNIRLVSGPLGYDRYVFDLPAGWQDVYLPSKENGVTLVEHVRDYYGVEHIITVGDERPEGSFLTVDADGNFLNYFNFTNSNKKWDWYQVGGRFTGRFADAYDPEKDERNLEWKFNNQIGAEERVPKWPTQWVKFEGDIIQKSALNIERQMDQKRREQGLIFDGYMNALKDIGFDFKTFDEIEIENHREKCDVYWAQPAMEALRKIDSWIETDMIKLIRDKNREKFVNSVASTYVAPRAFIVNGEWYQKGEMGWFGASHGDIDQMDWHDQFAGMLDSLQPTDWLTVVDCHI